MHNLFNIVLKDLRRRMRSPVAVLLMMLIPLAMTLIIGLVFGRSGTVELPRIKVLLVDRDGGIFGRFIRDSMRQDRLAELIDLESVEMEEGMRRMERGKASALIEVPEGFSESVLDMKSAEIVLVKNPAETFLPIIVEEIVETMAIIIHGGMYNFREPIERVRSMLEAEAWPSGGELQGLLDSARDKILLAQGYLSDSLITLRSETVASQDEGDGGFNLFAYVLPGSLLIGLLFISEISLRDLFRERNNGTLARMFVAPIDARQVVTAKVLVTAAVTGLSCIILMVIGRLGFGIDLGRPLPLIIHFVATILMCTGIIVFFYGFIRSEKAVDAVISIVIIVMCLLGGSMIPIEQMGSALSAVGRFSPVFWAVDGFKRIFILDAAMGDILEHLGILFGVSAITIIPGTIMLRRRIEKGGWS